MPRSDETSKLFDSDFAVGLAPSAFAMAAEEADIPNILLNVVAAPFGGVCDPFEERIYNLSGCVALRYSVDGYPNLR